MTPSAHSPQEKSPVGTSNAPDNVQGRVVGTITGVLDVVIKTTANENVDPTKGTFWKRPSPVNSVRHSPTMHFCEQKT